MASNVTTIPGYMKDLGFVRITNVAAATSLTVPNGTKVVTVQAEGQPVRYRSDGVDPTAAIGNLLATGQTLQFSSNIAAMKFIQTSATATLNVNFYGEL